MNELIKAIEWLKEHHGYEHPDGTKDYEYHALAIKSLEAWKEIIAADSITRVVDIVYNFTKEIGYDNK